MALTEALINAGWVEFNCPNCGKPNGQMDTQEQWDCSDGVGDRECEECTDE